MSNALESAAAALRESITHAIAPLQTTRVFRADAFAEQQRLEALSETIECYLHPILKDQTVAEGGASARVI